MHIIEKKPDNDNLTTRTIYDRTFVRVESYNKAVIVNNKILLIVGGALELVESHFDHRKGGLAEFAEHPKKVNIVLK